MGWNQIQITTLYIQSFHILLLNLKSDRYTDSLKSFQTSSSSSSYAQKTGMGAEILVSIFIRNLWKKCFQQKKYKEFLYIFFFLFLYPGIKMFNFDCLSDWLYHFLFVSSCELWIWTDIFGKYEYFLWHIKFLVTSFSIKQIVLFLHFKHIDSRNLLHSI